MRIKIDTLDYAMEGVLSMECKNNLQRLVAFLSKSLNETERNYKIHDKEMLEIVRGLEAWRHLLEGAQTKFEIWTDHKNLEWQLGVTREVEKYVERCDACQRIKNRSEELAEKLKLSEVPEKLWTHLIVDFIMKLPVVVRKDAILVVYDRLSKIAYFVAMTEGTLAKGLARLF